MKEDISFRPIKRSDYHELAEIINEAWHYKDFASEKTAHRLGLQYLAECMCSQNFTMAAFREDKPVGFIIGNAIKTSQSKADDKLYMIYQSLMLLSRKEGRDIVNTFAEFNNVDEELLDSTGREYDSEINLFIVKKSEKGLGIGGKLYDMLMDFFRSQGAKSCYVFTDTACDYEFYDHKGFKRMGEYKADLSKYNYPDFSYFIYTKDNI